jgi:hypothetical protein
VLPARHAQRGGHQTHHVLTESDAADVHLPAELAAQEAGELHPARRVLDAAQLAEDVGEL